MPSTSQLGTVITARLETACPLSAFFQRACVSNIFGGQDIIGPNGRVTTCRPNIFAGEDCRQ